MKWVVVAMIGSLLLCAEIGEAAARGFYSNFGAWSSHTHASDISAAPREHEYGVAKPLPRPGRRH